MWGLKKWRDETPGTGVTGKVIEGSLHKYMWAGRMNQKLAWTFRRGKKSKTTATTTASDQTTKRAHQRSANDRHHEQIRHPQIPKKLKNQ